MGRYVRRKNSHKKVGHITEENLQNDVSNLFLYNEAFLQSLRYTRKGSSTKAELPILQKDGKSSAKI